MYSHISADGADTNTPPASSTGAHNTRLPHRRSHSNGHLQWCAVFLCARRVRLGNAVRPSSPQWLSKLCYTNTSDACRCHLGRSIVYDTVSNLSWAVDIRTHGIVNVIENVLNKTWAPSEEIGREVPVAAPEEDCVVCRRSSTLVTEIGGTDEVVL